MSEITDNNIQDPLDFSQYERQKSVTFDCDGEFVSTGIPGTGYYARSFKNPGILPVNKVVVTKSGFTFSHLDTVDSNLNNVTGAWGCFSFVGIVVTSLFLIATFVWSTYFVIGLVIAAVVTAFMIRTMVLRIKDDDDIKAIREGSFEFHINKTAVRYWKSEAIVALRKSESNTKTLILQNFLDCISKSSGPDDIMNADKFYVKDGKKQYLDMLMKYEKLMRSHGIFSNVDVVKDGKTYWDSADGALYTGAFNFLKSNFDVPVIDLDRCRLYLYPGFLIIARTSFDFDVHYYYDITVMYSDRHFTTDKKYYDSELLESDSDENVYKFCGLSIKIAGESYEVMASNYSSMHDFVDSLWAYAELHRKSKSIARIANTNENTIKVMKDNKQSKALAGSAYFKSYSVGAMDLNDFVNSLGEDFNFAARVYDMKFDSFEEWNDMEVQDRIKYLMLADFCLMYERMGHQLNFSEREGETLRILVARSLYGFDPENLFLNEETAKQVDISDKIPMVGKVCNLLRPKGKVLNLVDTMIASGKSQMEVSKYAKLLAKLLEIVAGAANGISAQEKEIVDFVSNYQGSLGKGGANSSKDEKTALQMLDDLIGMDSVKEEVKKLRNFLNVQKMRKEKGMAISESSYHLVFTGNPGTGKTTVARIIAQIYKELGIFDKGHLVETDRSGLVANYLGQTASKTNGVVDSALGGILFIDEAYSLNKKSISTEDYGHEAIDTLLKRMEDDRDSFAVIIAGYPDEMEGLLDSNPGLRSRFNRYIHFPDYTSDELVQIFKFYLKKYSYKADDNVFAKLGLHFEKLLACKDRNFGNARLVRNIFEKTIENQSTRIAELSNVDANALETIVADDLAI